MFVDDGTASVIRAEMSEIGGETATIDTSGGLASLKVAIELL
jgi:hypothetical protein